MAFGTVGLCVRAYAWLCVRSGRSGSRVLEIDFQLCQCDSKGDSQFGPSPIERSVNASSNGKLEAEAEKLEAISWK